MAKVAVIGAGPQGLACLKNLLEEEFDVTLFEQRSAIGGLWAFDDDPTHTTVLKSTLGNVSKYKNCYGDFPIPDKYPVYLDQQQFLEYLHSYVEHFDLKPHIKLDTKITSVIRDEENQTWRLTQDGNQETSFDKVIIATGQYGRPVVPTIEGADRFTGKVIHSQAFKHAQSFSGKTVLVLGFGTTAADICHELVGTASKIYLSHRRGNYVFPRIVHRKPIDLIATQRQSNLIAAITCLAPIFSQTLLSKALRKLSNSCFKLDPKWNIEEAPPFVSNRPVISDTFIPNLTRGSVESVPVLKKILEGRSVELEGGLHLDIDCIICCTGYSSDWSLAGEPGVEEVGSGLARLYQNIFPAANGNSLAYLNNWHLGTGICFVADLVSMAIAQIWKGNSSLPSEAQMNRAIDAHHAWVRGVAAHESSAPKLVREGQWKAWLHHAAGTGVNEMLGYGLAGWKFWFKQRQFCNTLMTGVDSPHLLRLFPGRRKLWPGARDAILTANEDVERQFGAKAGDQKDK